jgi:predicted GNAT family N-acyltransferase
MDQETITSVAFDSPLMQDALDLRREVFVEEQGVPPEMEVDDEDAEAIHLVANIGARVVATLRITPMGNAERIGRVAVQRAFRRKGIGKRLVEHAMRLIAGNGGRQIVLHAQLQTTEFYRRLGYSEEGDVEMDAGIPHIWMRKRLSHAPG